MSFGIPVRNGLSIGLLASTFLTSGSGRLVPRFTLNFLTGAPLDSRVTFTRSTTATFVGSNGLIQTAAINDPRFGYNPATLTAKGLLIEETRTNLLTYSAQIDNAAWTKTNTTVSADAVASPDGTTSADKAIPTIIAGVHTVKQASGTVTSGATVAASIYAKKAEYTKILYRVGNAGETSAFQVAVDLNAGTISAPSAYGVGATVTSASISDAGNGWYRITLVGAISGLTAYNQINHVADASGNVVFAGDGTSGLYFWGAQIEAGAFATSYIPTVASTVARTADIAVMTGTNFSSWYNASEGTFVSSFEASPNTFTTYVAASNGVVAQNSMHMDNDGSGNMRVAYYSGSSAVALLSLGAVGTLGAVNTLATAYKVNDFAASRNGGAVVTDTAGAVPVGVVQLNIGADPSGAAVNVSNTHIRFITYYASRLTNAQLQALTA